MRDRMNKTDKKLDRLMQAYLDQTLSLDEYRQAKGKLVEEKQNWKDKLAAAEQNRGGWFEPAIRFVKACKEAAFLTKDGTDISKRNFLKIHGSNLKIENRHLSVTPRQPWQLVVDQGLFARNATPAPDAGAGVFGETNQDLNSAERGRFELPLPLRADRFSKPAHSTTLPPLQVATTNLSAGCESVKSKSHSAIGAAGRLPPLNCPLDTADL